MRMLKNTDPKRLDDYFRKWKYDPKERANNEMSMGSFGMRAAISIINVISFSLRMRVTGERRSKVVGRFIVNGNDEVIYGARKALADGMELREQWFDETEGKMTVKPSDIPTFAQMLTRYEEALKDPAKSDPELMGKKLPKSWYKRLPQIKNIYSPFMKDDQGRGTDVKVNNITQDAIHEAHNDYVIRQYKTTDNQPFSTVRLTLNAVRPVLKWANRKKWVMDETIKNLKARTPTEPGRSRFVFPGELQAALPAIDACHEDADVGRCMRFMLYTACRRSMATQMKWEQIETVSARGHKGGELTVWSVPAENMKQGVIAIFPLVGESLRIIEAIRNRPGNKCRPHDFVFSDAARSVWDSNADDWQKKIFAASGTKKWHRHDLRRTTATYLASFDPEMDTVRKLLGHEARGGNSATKRYISLPKSMGSLVKLAPQLERVHELYKTIEAGIESADLRDIYENVTVNPEVKAFMKEFDIDKSWIKIKASPKGRAPVHELRPAHG